MPGYEKVTAALPSVPMIVSNGLPAVKGVT